MKNFLFAASGLLLSLFMPLPALAQTPLPAPAVIVAPVGNRVSIAMINQTGAPIDYEVIGDTQYRSLGGTSEILLQNLSVPTTLTFRRQDGGLLQASLQTTAAGVLELRLSATTDFSRDRTALTIDRAGGVFIN
jgi:hypothetical protein